MKFGGDLLVPFSEEYLELFQTSPMELFLKVNS